MGGRATEVDELREVVREAHAAIKDLRGLIREAKEERLAMTAMLKEGIDEEIETLLQKGLDNLMEAFNTATEASSAAVIKRFDDLYDLLVGADWESRKQGRKTIPEMLAEVVGNDPAPSFVPPGLIIAKTSE